MSEDIGDTIAPKSAQLDAVDLVSGPRTFTVERVDVRANADQPTTVHLVEFDRPWKPSKGMRRVLVACWGKKSAVYAGRRVRLYCDPTVKWAGVEVGGIRISHLSDIGEERKVPQILGKNNNAVVTIRPIEEVDALRAEWEKATPERRAAIEAEMLAIPGGAR